MKSVQSGITVNLTGLLIKEQKAAIFFCNDIFLSKFDHMILDYQEFEKNIPSLNQKKVKLP